MAVVNLRTSAAVVGPHRETGRTEVVVCTTVDQIGQIDHRNKGLVVASWVSRVEKDFPAPSSLKADWPAATRFPGMCRGYKNRQGVFDRWVAEVKDGWFPGTRWRRRREYRTTGNV